MSDVEVMDMNAAERSELPMSRTSLSSCTNVVVVRINDQITSGASRKEEVSPFTPDYESTYQVPMINNDVRYEDKPTGQSCTLNIRDNIMMPAMHCNSSLQIKL